MLSAALLVIGPALLLAAWAWLAVRTVLARGLDQAAEAGWSGAEVAAFVLGTGGAGDVAVVRGEGWGGSRYHAGRRVLRLPPAIHDGRSLAALSLAAHESGHALQQRRGDGALDLRNVAVPLASAAWALGLPLFAAGLAVGLPELALGGAVAFATVVLLELLALPAEIGASRHAAAVLQGSGLVRGEQEDREVKVLLTAAALRSLAATLSGPFAWAARRREARRRTPLDL